MQDLIYQNLKREIGFIGKKFYVDEIYDSILVQPTKFLSTFIDKIVDDKIIDAFIMNSFNSIH